MIREICDENEKAVQILGRIGKDQAAFILSRWRMGRSIDELLDGARGQYGDSAVTAIADHTGLHPNIIYECRRFYIATENGPEQWIGAVVNRRGIVLWKDVRSLILTNSDSESIGQKGALERRIFNVDKRIQKLEDDMSDIARVAQSNGIDDDLKRKVLGVADRVADVKFGGYTGFSKEIAPRDDGHLSYVRELECAFCGAPPPSDPHHVEKVATGMQGNDYSCVPVCRECHNDIHNMGNWSFQVDRNTLFSEALAQTLAHRLCGQTMKLPKRPSLA